MGESGARLSTNTRMALRLAAAPFGAAMLPAVLLALIGRVEPARATASEPTPPTPVLSAPAVTCPVDAMPAPPLYGGEFRSIVDLTPLRMPVDSLPAARSLPQTAVPEPTVLMFFGSGACVSILLWPRRRSSKLSFE